MAQPLIESLRQTYWDFYGIRVTLSGKFNGGRNDNPLDWLAPVITELCSNTGHARQVFDEHFGEANMSIERLKQIGAERQRNPHRINITSKGKQITVEDDFDSPDPQLAMAHIQQALDSSYGKTTKKDSGGAGIFTIKKALDQHDGKLEYSIKGQRIVATVSWKK